MQDSGTVFFLKRLLRGQTTELTATEPNGTCYGLLQLARRWGRVRCAAAGRLADRR